MGQGVNFTTFPCLGSSHLIRFSDSIQLEVTYCFLMG